MRADGSASGKGRELTLQGSLARDEQEQVEAEEVAVQSASMRLRSALMAALKHHIEHIGLKQAKAAEALGVTQPRISDLMRGKIALFSLDTLMEMAAAAGLQVKIRVTKEVWAESLLRRPSNRVDIPEEW